ncbi:MAG: hypothetical protein ACWA5P_03290 [bacterium]
MLPLTSFLVDVLLYEEDDEITYYKNFIAKYSTMTISTLVSQLTFLPDTYTNMTPEALDNDIENLIKSIPKAAEKRRQAYPYYTLAAGIATGEIIQNEEERSFITEAFYKKTEKYSLTSREMILRELNNSAFLNYFFIIEDTLKKIYFQNTNSNEHIGSSKLISKILEGILNTKNIKNIFEIELHKRSKFFINLASLNRMWKLLNFIRNRLVHFNGYYDADATTLFIQYYENILKIYDNNDSMLLSISYFTDVIEKYKKEIEETNYLIIDDTLENIIRNISIFIMESLYVSEKMLTKP